MLREQKLPKWTHEQANNKFCLNCNQIAEWYRRKVEKSVSFLKGNHIILLGLNMFWNKSSPNRYYWYHTYQFCKYQICKYVHTYFLNVLFKPQRQHICQVQKRLTQESIWQKNERCGGLGVFFKNQTSSRSQGWHHVTDKVVVNRAHLEIYIIQGRVPIFKGTEKKITSAYCLLLQRFGLTGTTFRSKMKNILHCPCMP